MEWYFGPTFQLLRTVPNKLLGVDGGGSRRAKTVLGIIRTNFETHGVELQCNPRPWA
jgi:hypothetical protein